MVDWARILHRPPTASPVILGTGVLWVSTRDPPVWPSIQAGWWRNQSASLTYTGRRSTISRRRGIWSCAPTPLLDLFVSTIWSILRAPLRHRLRCLLRETCWVPVTVLRLYAALVLCLSSLYAFRYDDSLQAKREGVEFSLLEHSCYSVNGFT